MEGQCEFKCQNVNAHSSRRFLQLQRTSKPSSVALKVGHPCHRYLVRSRHMISLDTHGPCCVVPSVFTLWKEWPFNQDVQHKKKTGQWYGSEALQSRWYSIVSAQVDWYALGFSQTFPPSWNLCLCVALWWVHGPQPYLFCLPRKQSKAILPRIDRPRTASVLLSFVCSTMIRSNSNLKWKQVLGFDEGISPTSGIPSQHSGDSESDISQLLPLAHPRHRPNFPRLPKDVTFTRTGINDILLSPSSPAPSPRDLKPLPDPVRIIGLLWLYYPLVRGSEGTYLSKSVRPGSWISLILTFLPRPFWFRKRLTPRLSSHHFSTYPSKRTPL